MKLIQVLFLTLTHGVNGNNRKRPVNINGHFPFLKDSRTLLNCRVRMPTSESMFKSVQCSLERRKESAYSNHSFPTSSGLRVGCLKVKCDEKSPTPPPSGNQHTAGLTGNRFPG